MSAKVEDPEEILDGIWDDKSVFWFVHSIDSLKIRVQ